IYRRESALFAQHIDVRRLELDGEPVPIASDVRVNAQSGVRTAFSLSQRGQLAYVGADETQLVWFDRDGGRLEALGPPGLDRNPTIAPDGRVAFDRLDLSTGRHSVWILDPASGRASRLTAAAFDSMAPVWSHDRQFIAFASRRGGLVSV